MKSQLLPLEDLFDVSSSRRVLKSQWCSAGVPFYRGREITRLAKDGFVDNELFISEQDYADYSQKYGVPSAGDILITAIGTIGNAYIVQPGDRFYFKDASVLWLRKVAPVVSEFVGYWIKSPMFLDQLERGNGATVDTLTVKKLKSVRLVLPTLAEQKRIVAILDEAFAGIDQAVKNTEQNLASAREVFESELNRVFSEGATEWLPVRLGDLSQIRSGGTPLKSTSRYWDNGDIPWYTSGELNGLATVASKKCITLEGLENSNAKLFPKGALLMGMYDTAALKLSLLDRDGAFNQAVAGMLPAPELDLRFVLYAVRHVRPEVLKLRRGVRQKNLSLKKIKEIEIRLPRSRKGQEDIVRSILRIRDEVARLEGVCESKLYVLSDLRRAVLQTAFSGKLSTASLAFHGAGATA